ncbi:pitrilysin family protein [Maritimibacter sp. HL-12]|uniref:M16 family metallopeptidase n=1 Tax=Maritimibacter sp. HL-12 TaxID=1162418 RepID=UPI000A0F2A22|nr:pitrilysin family protein [Maritimibacter sp. HL-12]SMH46202.1 zinc protease [Maritimibacter sp. HL-12]
MRALLVAILALFLALPAQAAEQVTGFTLDNGMEVVVIEDHRAPVVVHMVWYRIGAADEPPGKSGIAHFLEHLMFKGTESRASGEFSRVVEANGGSDNAFTSYDYTAYFQRVAADRLGLMMEMEADRMRNLVLAPEAVDTEREVILEERASRIDNDPSALFREELRATQYRNHPYGIPIIGWRHEMEALSREDALAAYDRFYAPNNAILIVAGDVTPDEVRKLAKQHYGPLAPSDGIAPRDRPQEPPSRGERRLEMSDPRVAQPSLVRTYLAPARRSGAQEEAAALTFLAQLLGGSGATSVLGNALEFENNTAVYTSAGYGATSLDDSTFSFVVVPAEGVSLEQAEAALDAALEDFMETGPDPDRFERIKMQVRASEIYALDDVGNLANRYGRALTSGLTIADVQAWPEVLQAVTPEDVMEAAAKVLDRPSAVTGWLSPDVEEDAQ